jgi:hypothetical protein
MHGGEPALLVELRLPSGTGYAVRHGPAGALLLDRRRLVVYRSPADAGLDEDREPWDRHDLLGAADRLVARHSTWTPDLLDAVLLMHELATDLGLADVAGWTGPQSRLRTVAADQRLAEHLAVAEGVGPYLPVAQRGGRRFEGVPALELAALHGQWLDAVSRLDAAVLWRPEPPSEPAGAVVALEDLVPGVEVLWLAAAGHGGFTLVAGADPVNDQPTRFLGRPGRVEVFAGEAGLRAHLAAGAAAMPGVPRWHRLADAADTVDLQPYEDNVVDLDELGERLRRPRQHDADDLLRGWALVADLAAACGAGKVRDEMSVGPLARALEVDLPVIADGDLRAQGRLDGLDGPALADAWDALLSSLSDAVTWHEEG